MKAFKKWFEAATNKEIAMLAKKTRSSVNYIRHIASGYRTASAEMAGKIENGTAQMERDGLPKVLRGDLNGACRKCPYFNNCTEKKS